MKKIASITVILLLSVFSLHAKDKSQGAQSPPLKIGYVNFEYILRLLPELKAAKSELASLDKQLNKHMAAKLEDYRKKEEAFKKGSKTADESVIKQQVLELQRLEKSIRQFQLESSEKLDSKEASLINPIYDKVQDAITQTAKEYSYTCVLNASLGRMLPILLYAGEEHDISDRVLKKLGVDLDKAGSDKK